MLFILWLVVRLLTRVLVLSGADEATRDASGFLRPSAPRTQKARSIGRRSWRMRCCVEDEGCGPSESPCGGRLQTASCCVGRRPFVVSDEGKAPVEASGRDQEGERKRIAAEVSKRNETASKLGHWGCPRTSLAGARFLARWCPAWRRREPGLRLSRGTWEGLSRHSHPRRGSAGGDRERGKRLQPQGAEYRRGAGRRTGS
jgi:hypothetical protein